MTDKQIIIDYKNLCENYSKEVGCYVSFDGSCTKEQCFTYKLLQQNNNLEKENIDLKLNLKKVINLSQKKNRQCYQFLADIKQLKQQHQADKGLITSTGKMNYQLLQEYDKLKTENEELKKRVDDLLHKPEIQDKILWKIDNETLLGSKDAYIYKLEQTLTEIKEIAEHCINQDICTTCDNSDKCHIENEEIPTYDVCKLILQKISECEANK